jgi:hypothetical protein
LPDRVPAVEASFENQRGVFRLDSGAPGSAILFHAPAVSRLNLLANRDTSESSIGGVGGLANARQGKLASFGVGNHGWTDVDAWFATDQEGALADPWISGIVALNRFDPWVLLLDYGRRQYGLVER